MRVQGQQAVVLHTRPWSESSRLVDLFTREFGIVRLIAKGCRRRKSRTRASLMPFRLLIVGWSGKGELPTLTGVEAAARPHAIGASVIVSAWYMNELLMRFLARLDTHPTLFDHYLEALSELAEANPVDLVLRKFERRLLGAIGYGLALEREADSRRLIREDAEYWYVMDKGAVPYANDVRDSTFVSMSESTAVRVSGATLLAIQSDRLQDFGSREEARALLRAAITERLGGKPLRSRNYLNQLRQFELARRASQQ